MQSAAWAEYRRSQGLDPHFLTFEDGRVALATLRASAGLPGVEAVVRRGPALADGTPQGLAARARRLADWAGDRGARDLFLDPELAADDAYEQAMDAAGFSIAHELEPSIHVMRLDLDPGVDADTVFAGLSKSTRQRVRSAQAAGTVVAHDEAGQHLDAFVLLMRARAAALGIPLREDTDYLRGWRALMDAGLAHLLVALHADELVGGLFVYRQGGIWATAYSADDAARRKELPGTMHLVRWTAVRDAIADGAAAIELGGVDLPGHRDPPRPGDPNRGLYEHKRGFGAHWVQRSSARRIVLRPWADRFASVRRRSIDAIRRMRR